MPNHSTPRPRNAGSHLKGCLYTLCKRGRAIWTGAQFANRYLLCIASCPARIMFNYNDHREQFDRQVDFIVFVLTAVCLRQSYFAVPPTVVLTPGLLVTGAISVPRLAPYFILQRCSLMWCTLTSTRKSRRRTWCSLKTWLSQTQALLCNYSAWKTLVLYYDTNDMEDQA